MSVSMSRFQETTDNQDPRWGVKIELENAQDPQRRHHTRRKRDRFRFLRVFMMSTFLVHAIVYGAIMAMLLLINLLAWNGMLWMMFPAIGWGAFLAIHGGLAYLTANAGVSNRMVERAREPLPTPAFRKPNLNTPEGELNAIVLESLAKVDQMRAIGRNMRTPSARRNSLIAVGAIENTLLALEGNTDELPLARDFAGSFIEPAHRIFVEYDRLSQRDIQSAKALLQQVEQHDLPRITERAEKVHERVHRGTMIDLQVAREMLNLGDGE